MSDPGQQLEALIAANDWRGADAWAQAHAAVSGWEVAARTVADRLERDRPHFEHDGGPGFTSIDECLFRGICRIRRIAARSGGVIEEDAAASNSYGYVVIVQSAGSVALAASLFQDVVAALALAGEDRTLTIALRELTHADEPGAVPRETALVPGNVVVLAPSAVAGERHLYHLPTRYHVAPGASLRPWLAEEGVVALTPVGGVIRAWWIVAKIETEIAGIDRRVRRGGEPSSSALQELRELCALRSALADADRAAEPLSERASAVVAALAAHADAASLCTAVGWR